MFKIFPFDNKEYNFDSVGNFEPYELFTINVRISIFILNMIYCDKCMQSLKMLNIFRILKHDCSLVLIPQRPLFHKTSDY